MNKKPPFNNVEEFRLLNIIQEGPYSLAIKGYQQNLRRLVFVKLLKPHSKDHARWVQRFTREAQICARLKHPNIVDVYSMGEIENHLYVIQEYILGLSLKELLSYETSFNIEPAGEIVRQVLLALKIVHNNGIIHRDIKPGNIMLDINGQVRLTDFGLAHLGEEPSLTQQGTMLGTPAYMAPEQITGETLSPATDFFALGATWYEMITGIKPFTAETHSACIQKILNEELQTPRTFAKGISSEMEELILQMVHKVSHDRPYSEEKILTVLHKNLVIGESDRILEISNLVNKHYAQEEIQQTDPEKPQKLAGINKKEHRLFSTKRILTIIIPAILIVLSALFGKIFWNIIFRPGNDMRKITNESAAVRAKDDAKKTLTGLDKSLSNQAGKFKSLSGRNLEKKVPQKVNPAFKNNYSRKHQLQIKPDTIADKISRDKNLDKAVPPSETIPGTGINNHNYSAELQVQIIPWATIQLDGNVIDSSVHSKSLSLTPGKHRIILTHPEFKPEIVEINIAAGEKMQIRHSFIDDAGFIEVEVRPWAEVYLDGEYFDTTPLDRLIITGSGQHLLELRHPEYPAHRELIFLRSGDTLSIKKNLGS